MSRFYVGQEVVCIDDKTPYSPLPVKKGHSYIVTAIRKSFCNCGGFNISVGFKVEPGIWSCPFCRSSYIDKSTDHFMSEKRFIPVD